MVGWVWLPLELKVMRLIWAAAINLLPRIFGLQKNATQAQKTMARWVCLSLHEVGATFFLCPVELLMVKVILSQGDTAKKIQQILQKMRPKLVKWGVG